MFLSASHLFRPTPYLNVPCIILCSPCGPRLLLGQLLHDEHREHHGFILLAGQERPHHGQQQQRRRFPERDIRLEL